MYISYKAHDPSKFGLSSKGMIEYLTKEEKTKDQSRFFNHEEQNISFEKAYLSIDNNKGSHSNKASKFYMMNISPSEKELNHLDKLAQDYSDNCSKSDLSKEEIKKLYFEKLLQEYTYKIMNDYAQNFERDKTVDDLVYYAKIEHKREYKEQDKEVKHNKKIYVEIQKNPDKEKELESKYIRNSKGEILKEKMEKEGNNTHIHVVVSRYEKSGNQRDKMSLSPMSKARKTKGLNNSKVGFDRDRMNQKAENRFDDMFNFERLRKDSYEHKKIMKKEYKKSQNKESSIANEIIKGEINEIKKDIISSLRDNKVIDSSIPTSLQEVKFKIERSIKNELGIEKLKSPKEFMEQEYKYVRDIGSKGVHLGY